ncbi:MAG: hypothetical protein BA865_00750 [Desulfobacterales bacterium S5133MH4]|nr:MAG: hypothetical protein BA865_00750 [Desulfobacterales bacterium S5133MH4]
MKKMRNTFLGIFLTAGFFLLSVGMARSAGIPMGYLIADEGEFSVVLFNFDQNYPTQEVNGLFEMSQFVLELVGDYLEGGSVVAVGPNDLPDADITHAWILDNLSLFEVYLQVDATKVSGPAGTNVRFDLWLWASDVSGQYLGALEVLEELMNDPTSLF